MGYRPGPRPEAPLRTLPLLLALACATEPEVPGAIQASDDVVLTADGHPIDRTTVTAALDRLPAQQRQALEEAGQTKALVSSLAVADAMYRKAIDEGLHGDPKVSRAVALAARDVLSEAWLERQIDAKVTDDKLREAYEARKVQYAVPSADLRVMVLKDGDAAAQAVTQLRAGADFGAMAEELSIDKRTGQQGGAIGRAKKGQLPPPVDEEVFGTDAEGVLDPIEAQGVYFVVEASDRQAEQPFEDVREELVAVVRDEVADALITDVEEAVTIEWKVDEDQLGTF